MKVLIRNEAFLKMQGYIDLSETEISGVGKVSVDGDNIIVEDVILLEQKNTGTNSFISEGADDVLLRELVARNENPEDWKLWWHSHANMSVFWSGTDEDTIKKHIKPNTDGENLDFFLSIVGNKKMEYKVRIDVSTYDKLFGIRGVETRDDLPFERILPKELEEQVSEIRKEFDKLEAKNKKLEEKRKEIEEEMGLLELQIDEITAIEENEDILKQCKEDIDKFVIKKPVVTIYNKNNNKDNKSLEEYYGRYYSR